MERLYKAGELLIEYVLQSPEINRFTMMSRELPIETGLATLFEQLRDAPVEKPKSVTLVRK